MVKIIGREEKRETLGFIKNSTFVFVFYLNGKINDLENNCFLFCFVFSRFSEKKNMVALLTKSNFY